jgi:hypothetical protein
MNFFVTSVFQILYSCSDIPFERRQLFLLETIGFNPPSKQIVLLIGIELARFGLNFSTELTPSK